MYVTWLWKYLFGNKLESLPAIIRTNRLGKKEEVSQYTLNVHNAMQSMYSEYTVE